MVAGVLMEFIAKDVLVASIRYPEESPVETENPSIVIVAIGFLKFSKVKEIVSEESWVLVDVYWILTSLVRRFLLREQLVTVTPLVLMMQVEVETE